MSEQQAPRSTEREQYYRELFKEHAESGLPLARFAAERGLVGGTVKWWKRELRRRDALREGREIPLPKPREQSAVTTLVPVSLTDRGVPAASSGLYEVALPGGAAVRVPYDFDTDSFRRLVTVLGSAC
jgi:hypothetical protein